MLFFVICVAYGSDKNFGRAVDNLARDALGNIAIGLYTLGDYFSPSEQQSGYALASVATGEIHDFTRPDNSSVADKISKRGANNDGYYLNDSYTNYLNRIGLDNASPLWVHTDGSVTLKNRALSLPLDEIIHYESYSNVTVFAPRYGEYGFLPSALWETNSISCIWTAVNEAGSRVITWEGALEDRIEQRCSFQMEFKQGGGIVYRYAPMLGDATNSVGLFRNGTYNALSLPTNTTTAVLTYIGDLDPNVGDTDGDGLSDYEEVKTYYTDPRLTDTDGDGLSDSIEATSETSPLNPDTDGDGVPDSITIEYAQNDPHRIMKAAHNLPAETDYTVDDNENGIPDWAEEQYGENMPYKFTVTLDAAPQSPGVLSIGSNRLLIAAAGSWDFWLCAGIDYKINFTKTAYTPEFRFSYDNEEVIYYSANPKVRSPKTSTHGGVFLPIVQKVDSVYCCHEVGEHYCNILKIAPQIPGMLYLGSADDYVITNDNMYAYKGELMVAIVTFRTPDNEFHDRTVLLNSHCMGPPPDQINTQGNQERYLFVSSTQNDSQSVSISLPEEESQCCYCSSHNFTYNALWECKIKSITGDIIVSDNDGRLFSGDEIDINTTLTLGAYNISSTRGDCSMEIEHRCLDTSGNVMTNITSRFTYTVLPADRPPIRLESITTKATGSGVIYNPSGVGLDMFAPFCVENDYPTLIPADTIHWSANNNNVIFSEGNNDGEEVIVKGMHVGFFKLNVEIDGFPDTYRPYIYGKVVRPVTNKIKAYVVCNTNGVPAISDATVNDWVEEANRIYRQIAVSFELESIERVVSHKWFNIESNEELFKMISNKTGDECIKVHFINNFDLDRDISGICVQKGINQNGKMWAYIAIESAARPNTLAHELGHVGNLRDIKYNNTSSYTSEDLQGDYNWTGGDNLGYNRNGTTHNEVVQRVLMYYRGNNTKVDIPLDGVTGNHDDLTMEGKLSVDLITYRTLYFDE